jgi:hypothetical protein
MAKKRKLNAISITRPSAVEPTPVHATTYQRTKGRLRTSNTILTPSEPLDDDAPHLNPWEDQFFEAFSMDVASNTLVSAPETLKVSLSYSSPLN